jgi:hypothetical protein
MFFGLVTKLFIFYKVAIITFRNLNLSTLSYLKILQDFYYL